LKNKVKIRVDGSPKIGLGHVTRSFALAEMIKDFFEVTFFSIELPPGSKTNLCNAGFKVVMIGDEDDFFNCVSRGDVVVIDGHSFDATYQKRLKSYDIKLVCIDDVPTGDFFADLIINHAPGVSSSDYRAQQSTAFALGLHYALLRPSFLKQAQIGRVIERIETVIICFGGSDIQNLTKKALQVVLDFKMFKQIHVITGESFMHLDTVEELVKNASKAQHHHNISAERVAQLLSESDLAVVPASGVLFEALSSGCKVVSGMYVENQRILFTEFKKLDAFVSAESFGDTELKGAIKSALDGPFNSLKLIDGNSGKRNLFAILQLIASVRSVTISDEELLFIWANDITVRQNAISQKNIEWADHMRWFRNKLETSRSKMFILECGDIPVGQIRYDLEEDYWLIDYSIDKKYRGFGFGSTIVKLTLPFLEGQKTKALVKKENNSSKKIFHFLNFKEMNSIKINNDDYLMFEYHDQRNYARKP
jgi:UDP-2,4-diacetamido-2,4,6-trideoxy-beta-L-altropyranose hydrolase